MKTPPERFEAIKAGRDAAAAGLSVTACPHPADGPKAHLRAVWVRAYASHPAAVAKVDYSD